jgi:hypothetical protein
LRRKPTQWGAKTGHFIGGFVNLTTVTATGVTMETLKDWPDCEGFPIDPARQWNQDLSEFATWVN